VPTKDTRTDGGGCGTGDSSAERLPRRLEPAIAKRLEQRDRRMRFGVGFVVLVGDDVDRVGDRRQSVVEEVARHGVLLWGDPSQCEDVDRRFPASGKRPEHHAPHDVARHFGDEPPVG
jgi:alkanesulfonate monooxygenase SsuD/methylene tetrahydromethanopterin reductase-like flavin-dependent oxidoreductase (luciferase family)